MGKLSGIVLAVGSFLLSKVNVVFPTKQIQTLHCLASFCFGQQEIKASVLSCFQVECIYNCFVPGALILHKTYSSVSVN